MTIEVTDEMLNAFLRAHWEGPDEFEAGEPERAGLAAVLAIVEREHAREVAKLRGALTLAGRSRNLWRQRAINYRWPK